MPSNLQVKQRKTPVVCSLYEAHAKSVQDYNFEQQHGLKSGLLDDHPSCAFAQLSPDNPPEEHSIWLYP